MGTQQNTNKEDKYLSGDKAKNVSVNVSAVSSSSGVPSGADNIDAYGHPHAPSAKEVSKSLSNAMSGGKLVGQGNDSFDPRKQVASGAGPGGYPSRGPPPPPGGMDMKAANDVLSGYAQQNNYNNYSKQSSYGNQYSQNQYGGPTNPNQSSTYGSSSASSSSGYASQNNYSSSSTPNTQQLQTGYKGSSVSASYPASSGQTNDNSLSKTGFGADSTGNPSANNAAVLGLTSTTNSLSGKVSASTASKVNVPNLPPGVASMLPPQYMASLPAAAFYGLQQPAAAMYSAYGNAGLEDLAALQRQAGLHTLVGSTATGANALAQAQALASGNPTVHQPTAGGTVKGQTTGYYDPSNQYAATSLAAAAGRNQSQDGGSSLNSLSTSVSTATTMTGSSSTNTGFSGSSSNLNSGSDKSAFGSVAAAMNNSIDSTSSPIPNASNPNNQQTGNLQQAGLNFATNAFAAQQAALPPGYAYFYGQVPNLQAAYGATAAGGTATPQFQKSAYGTSYGSGYDSLGQGQGKQDFNNYSTGNGTTGKSSGAQGSSGTGGPGKGHQYWGNSQLGTTQLWG